MLRYCTARIARLRLLNAARALTAPQYDDQTSPPAYSQYETVELKAFCKSQLRWLQQGLPQRRTPSAHPVVSSEARLLFDEVWGGIEEKYGRDLVIPREIVWLNGAPGAGKGANTPFILSSRGLGRSVCLSELLAVCPVAYVHMEKGELIPEKIVLEALFTEIFDPILDDGIGMIIDGKNLPRSQSSLPHGTCLRVPGYPRTAIQVDSLKLLYDKLMQLYDERRDASPSVVIPKPSFKLVVLYVDEATSIARQQRRGVIQSQKTLRAQDAGAHDLEEIDQARCTDLNLEQCKKRYAIFKAHYGTLLRLKTFFPFHLIDAVGTLDDTRRQITRELRYQSSTDLNAETYDAIRHLPMAKELSKLSRQQLTARLDTYAASHSDLFKKIIEIIDQSVLPILKRSGMAGEAHFVTRNTIFRQMPLGVDILIDVLSDRGYHVSYWQDVTQVPVRVDLKTGEIVHERCRTHRFKIAFVVSSVRDLGDTDIAPCHRGDGSGIQEGEIGASFMPEGTDHQVKYEGPSARESLIAHYFSHGLDGRQEGLADSDPLDPETHPQNSESEDVQFQTPMQSRHDWHWEG